MVPAPNDPNLEPRRGKYPFRFGRALTRHRKTLGEDGPVVKADVRSPKDLSLRAVDPRRLSFKHSEAVAYETTLCMDAAEW